MENYLDLKNKLDCSKLTEPAKIINKGGIVIFPTETVYGIGVNALNESAVKRLYEVKQRPLSKPISLLVSNIDMVSSLAKNITDIEYKLMENFFPGPLTIILEKRDIVPNILTSGSNTVGIRMPDNIIALELIKYANVPLATPSANISGKPSGTDLSMIMSDFIDKVDYFIDGGPCKIKTASTIVKVVNGKPVILRQGSITLDEIEHCLK